MSADDRVRYCGNTKNSVGGRGFFDIRRVWGIVHLDRDDWNSGQERKLDCICTEPPGQPSIMLQQGLLKEIKIGWNELSKDPFRCMMLIRNQGAGDGHSHEMTIAGYLFQYSASQIFNFWHLMVSKKIGNQCYTARIEGFTCR